MVEKFIYIKDKEGFINQLKAISSPRFFKSVDLFTEKLIYAMTNKTGFSIDGHIFGVPTDAYINISESGIKTLVLLVSPTLIDGDYKVINGICKFDIDLSKYYLKGPANSNPNAFEFSSIVESSSDYITIMFDR